MPGFWHEGVTRPFPHCRDTFAVPELRLTRQQIVVERFNLMIPQSVQELWLYDLRSGKFTLLVHNAARGEWVP